MKEWDRQQTRIADWKAAIMPPEKNTPQAEFDRSLEEVVELQQAIEDSDGSRQSEVEIGEEATDVIIRMLGLITVVNCNAAELLDRKITETTTKKYPPELIKPLMQRGLIWESAMSTAKRMYQFRNSK
jgi:NTP pyrophosphatase (non-canonical NTP hydrolase)